MCVPKLRSQIEIFAFLCLLSLASGDFAWAQNRVDLEDMDVKGELLNENRLNLYARDPYQQADRATYRENFRPEVIDGLEKAWPQAEDH